MIKEKNREVVSCGVLGNGFVGAILKQYYPEAKVYDIKDSPNTLEEVLNNKYIFLAYNVLDNCLSDESLDTVFDYCSQMKDGTVVIIKSTFIPGTADKIQAKFPNLKIVYNPEFLTEATAWHDFTKPIFQIIGVTDESKDEAEYLFSILPDAPIKRVMTAKEAEVVKHAKNSYYALKVIWFNQLYDACRELKVDYEAVRSILVNDPWIGDSHSIIYHKGYRGFGGKCLSKDPLNFTKTASLPILEEALRINKLLGN
jgi:nucleotide sugar dehydrogenase